MAEEIDTPKPDTGAEYLKKAERWMERIRASEKREDRWRKDAEEAERVYAVEEKGETGGKLYDFNILHSNVETIVPAIYNSTPIPDIRRRWLKAGGKAPQPPKQPQPPQGAPQGAPQPGGMPQGGPPQAAPQAPVDPQAAALHQQQMLQFQQAMQAWQQQKQEDEAARDAGMVIERAIAHQIDDNRLDTEIESVAQDAFLSGRGVIRLRFEADFVQDEMGNEVATNERITFQAVSWRDFRMGPGKRWEDKPWVAFRHCMTREELEDFQDPELVATQGPPSSEGVQTDEDDDVIVWEIWCKSDRQVKFIAEENARLVKIEDDPLGLPGFFPCPEPVQPIKLTGKMTPVCPFAVYRKLADELDTCTRRINKIMQGLKVRGVAAGNSGSIQRLAEAEDNELVIEPDLEQLAQTQGGLVNAIAWWPIEQGAKVLQQLYVQREQIKASIYEITGISDIVRGASDARETLGAQEIKTKWGSLRIQKMQRLIERQVRDIFVMMADIIAAKFSPQTLEKMTGLKISPLVLAILQQPPSSSYRIDVESDSTVRADLSREKQDMAEFLNGTAMFFKIMGPLIQQAPQIAEPVARIYGAFSRVWRLGRDAEMALDEMAEMGKQVASQKKPSPEEQKVQGEMAIEKMRAQIEGQRAQIDMAIKQIELEIKKIDLQVKQVQASATQARAQAEVITAMNPAPQPILPPGIA